MKLYFARHGESEANIRHVISNRASPFGLTERGREQARALADRLKDVPFTAIYSSPILRARESAAILSETVKLPYKITETLREYDCGVLEGKVDEESWRLHRQFYEDWIIRRNYTSNPTGGESFMDIRDRFLPFIKSLGRKSDDHILLIGHGGLFHLMLPLLLTNIDLDFVRSHGIGHTECIIAELHADGFRCLQWGDQKIGNPAGQRAVL